MAGDLHPALGCVLKSVCCGLGQMLERKYKAMHTVLQ